MAKRVRGGHPSHRARSQGPSRSGERRPATRPTSTAPASLAPAAPPPVPTATATVDRPSPPLAPSPTDAAVSRSMRGRVKVKPNSLLAARAASEYVYVGQDLRRIAVVAGGLFGTLLILWLLIVVLDLFGLY